MKEVNGTVSEPNVRVLGDTVSIDGMAIVDATLADLLRHREQSGVPAADTVSDAIEIGARVLDREATRAEVDFVKHEFEKASDRVEAAFGERADKVADDLQKKLERFLAADSGEVARTLDAHAGQLGEMIAAHFGGDRSTAVQHQIREQMTKLLSSSREDLLRQFSAEDGHNPLADFKQSVVRQMDGAQRGQRELVEKLKDLEAEVKRLHDARAAAAELAAERERGTSKGRSFEQRVFETLDQMAVARGDAAHHVGDERSASGGKSGDIVIEIDATAGPSRGRVAFDAKDERLSKNKAWETLNASLVERDADFAVLVVASDEKVPAGREQLHEYEGNKMIVALDRETLDERALRLAYGAARMRCLMAAEKELELDAAGVRDAAQEALSALRDAQKIRSSLTGASKGVKTARDALDAMVERVERAIERVESLITSA